MISFKKLLTLLPLLSVTLTLMAGCGGSMPGNLGVRDHHLAPCPTSPNCVSSMPGADEKHAIAPLTYDGSPAEARQRLLDVIDGMPRTTVITADEDYVYVEFRSGLFRFVDDVEFYFDAAQPGVIHVRSASRKGYSDLGVNRKRIDTIRERFSAAQP